MSLKRQQRSDSQEKKLLKDSNQNNNLKKKQESDQEEEKKEIIKIELLTISKLGLPQNPNLQFYQNKFSSKPNGNLIDIIHQNWYGNYKLLEDHHGYVQWLFPNYHQSRFNDNAAALNKYEADIFRKDKKIAEKIVKSFELIMDFFGIVLENAKTGKLARSKDYKNRYYDTFITSFHNHMRITRILSHLNIVGFRKYAISLVQFLEKEIYGGVGNFQKFQNDQKHMIFKMNEIKEENAPLKQLIKYNAYENWYKYGKVDFRKNAEKFTLIELTSADYSEILDESVFFKQ